MGPFAAQRRGLEGVPAKDTELGRMITEWVYAVRNLFIAADKREGALFGFMHGTFQDTNMEIIM